MILNEEQKYQIAKDAVKHWDIEVKDLSLLPIHTENEVFKLEDVNGNFFALRIHRFGYHDLEELESEHIWTSYLKKSGLNVPEFINTKREKPYKKIYIKNSEDFRYVGIVKWIRGETLEDSILKDRSESNISNIFERLGELIAQFHITSIDWDPPKGFKRHSWDEEGLMGHDPTWGRFWEIKYASNQQRSQLLDIQNRLYKKLKNLTKGNYYSMTHADMNWGNVLIEGQKLSVIDFDDCCFGWHAGDLANSIWNTDPQFASIHEISKDALVRGYKSLRNDSDQVIKDLDLFYLVRCLQILKWVEDREKEIGDIEPIIDSILRPAINRAIEMEIIKS